MATVERFDDEDWDCSCGEEDQPINSFWGMEVTCSNCGAVFCFDLDGCTETGFRWENPTEFIEEKPSD